MFTKLCLASRSRMAPSYECVVKVAELFEPREVWTLHGYGQAISDQPPWYEASPIALDGLCAALDRCGPCVRHSIHLDTSSWGDRLYAEARELIESAGEGCILWDVFIDFGEVMVPSQAGEATTRRSGIMVVLCGDGKPPDLDEYVSALLETPMIKAMLLKLGELVGPYDVIPVWS